MIVAEPLTGTAEEARGRRSTAWPSYLTAGGGAQPSPCRPRRSCAGGAGDELDRQAALYGVGSDLVLRNRRRCGCTGCGSPRPTSAARPGSRRRYRPVAASR